MYLKIQFIIIFFLFFDQLQRAVTLFLDAKKMFLEGDKKSSRIYFDKVKRYSKQYSIFLIIIIVIIFIFIIISEAKFFFFFFCFERQKN